MLRDIGYGILAIGKAVVAIGLAGIIPLILMYYPIQKIKECEEKRRKEYKIEDVRSNKVVSENENTETVLLKGVKSVVYVLGLFGLSLVSLFLSIGILGYFFHDGISDMDDEL